MRWRKISKAYEEVKREDPFTSITQYAIRQMVINGEVSHIKRGRKILLDYDELQEYLSTSAKKTKLYRDTGNPYIKTKVRY